MLIKPLMKSVCVLGVLVLCGLQSCGYSRIEAKQLSAATESIESISAVNLISSPIQTGEFTNPKLREISGIASSQRVNDLFWAVNDSGNGPHIFAVNSNGTTLGEWEVDAKNYDWEDMSSVLVGGEPYLLVADIGDNRRSRQFYRVDIFEEPHINDKKKLLKPIATIRWVYPDQSHNAEAMTTDGEWIYIMTKASAVKADHSTNGVYRVPFALSPKDLYEAEYLGDMPKKSMAFNYEKDQEVKRARLFKPTALEIDNSSSSAYILTYGHVIKIEKQAQQDWGEALLTGGYLIHSHRLQQAEALTVDRHGVVRITSEQQPAPFWSIPNSF